jgi:dolichol-phosphate mannosyltransferase
VKILVVVPTYNEALNIPLLIPRLLVAGPDLDILVVDDGSPDGTGQATREQMRANPGRIDLLERSSKSGRGGAVMAGFRLGLADSSYDWFCEIDADLSHQPEELPSLFAASTDADMVVGSRYLAGGRIEGWSLLRRVWSRVSNRIIRTVLGVPLTDFTNGYRLYNRRAVAFLAAAPLHETGYITLSEWAYALHGAGMALVEVPTVFINRRLGKSNMSAAEAINALRGLIRMKRRLAAGRG